MDRIRIIGGKTLHGKVKISGAKNAALPLMAASLLSEEGLTLTNLPHLADIMTMTNLLAQHGVKLTLTDTDGGALFFDASNIYNLKAPYEVVRKMRASILVLGPLLARFGKAKVSLPGGCAIGTRPVDLHLSALEKMGAEIRIKEILGKSALAIGGDEGIQQLTVAEAELVVIHLSVELLDILLRIHHGPHIPIAPVERFKVAVLERFHPVTQLRLCGLAIQRRLVPDDNVVSG